MNDFDLESKLKNLPVPGRTEEYWNDFPSRVGRQLRRERTENAPRPAWRFRPVWAGGFALTVVLALVCLQSHPLRTTSAALRQYERQVHVQFARLDSGLHVLMFNPHGMGYLLAEPN